MKLKCNRCGQVVKVPGNMKAPSVVCPACHKRLSVNVNKPRQTNLRDTKPKNVGNDVPRQQVKATVLKWGSLTLLLFVYLAAQRIVNAVALPGTDPYKSFRMLLWALLAVWLLTYQRKWFVGFWIVFRPQYDTSKNEPSQRDLAEAPSGTDKSRQSAKRSHSQRLNVSTETPANPCPHCEAELQGSYYCTSCRRFTCESTLMNWLIPLVFIPALIYLANTDSTMVGESITGPQDNAIKKWVLNSLAAILATLWLLFQLNESLAVGAQWLFAPIYKYLLKPILSIAVFPVYRLACAMGQWVLAAVDRQSSGKQCGGCGRTVPGSAVSGQSCPHCGVRWSGTQYRK